MIKKININYYFIVIIKKSTQIFHERKITGKHFIYIKLKIT